MSSTLQPTTQQPGWTALLERFYSRAGLTLPPLERLKEDEVPQPYKGLLVHSQDMTPTLEKFYGKPLGLTVLSREVAIRAYTSKRRPAPYQLASSLLSCRVRFPYSVCASLPSSVFVVWPPQRAARRLTPIACGSDRGARAGFKPRMNTNSHELVQVRGSAKCTGPSKGLVVTHILGKLISVLLFSNSPKPCRGAMFIANRYRPSPLVAQASRRSCSRKSFHLFSHLLLR